MPLTSREALFFDDQHRHHYDKVKQEAAVVTSRILLFALTRAPDDYAHRCWPAAARNCIDGRLISRTMTRRGFDAATIGIFISIDIEGRTLPCRQHVKRDY